MAPNGLFDNFVYVDVTRRGIGFSNKIGFIGQFDMKGFPVNLGIDHGWDYPQLPASTDNSDRNLSSIDNQNFFK
jgi:hypothetical protein